MVSFAGLGSVVEVAGIFLHELSGLIGRVEDAFEEMSVLTNVGRAVETRFGEAELG